MLDRRRTAAFRAGHFHGHPAWSWARQGRLGAPRIDVAVFSDTTYKIDRGDNPLAGLAMIYC